MEGRSETGSSRGRHAGKKRPLSISWKGLTFFEWCSYQLHDTNFKNEAFLLCFFATQNGISISIQDNSSQWMRPPGFDLSALWSGRGSQLIKKCSNCKSISFHGCDLWKDINGHGVRSRGSKRNLMCLFPGRPHWWRSNYKLDLMSCCARSLPAPQLGVGALHHIIIPSSKTTNYCWIRDGRNGSETEQIFVRCLWLEV